MNSERDDDILPSCIKDQNQDEVLPVVSLSEGGHTAPSKSCPPDFVKYSELGLNFPVFFPTD